MAINVGIQRIIEARARRINSGFSVVDCYCERDEHYNARSEVSLFIEGPGHEDAAARIAALINEQVARRDRPAPLPYENSATIPHDDGPDYEDEDGIPDPEASPDGPDDENEALRMETEQNISLGQAREAAEEERAYNEEDRLGKEAHLRSVRRDDKPWTPHEDQIEEDVRAGRRDADGEPLTQEEIEKQEAERNLPYSGSF